jgi:hypothetical protein
LKTTSPERSALRVGEDPGDLFFPKSLLPHPLAMGLESDHHALGKVDATPTLGRLGFVQRERSADFREALNAEGVPSPGGRRWGAASVMARLRNETYVGTLLYNRTSKKLKAVASWRRFVSLAIWASRCGSLNPRIPNGPR